MAAAVTQILEDSERNFVIHITGTATDATVITIDISALAANTRHGVPVRLRLDKLKYTTNALITLAWDATANVTFLNLPVGQEDWNFKPEGGINNNAGTGVTGDVLITPTNTTDFDMTLWFTKKFT